MDLSNYQLKKTKITSERQLILGEFLERLNSDRKPPFKPIAPARLGMLLQFTTTSQLKMFLGDCKYANNFSKYFWWKMKGN